MSANSRIFKGPGPIQVPRLSSDPASGVNGELYYNTTSNVHKQHRNGAWEVVVDESSIAGVAANKTLSNLTNPTAVNEHLIPSADDSKTIGLVGTRWANVFSAIVTGNDMRVKDTGSANYVKFQAPSLSAITTYTLPAADGSNGQQLTTNGSGILSWGAPGTGDANTALSNLAAVAINTALLPGADNTLAFGSASFRWTTAHLAALSSPGTIVANVGTAFEIRDVANTAAMPLRFFDDNSSNYVAFKAPPTITTDVTWVLPAADGTSGQILSTNGSGVLSWATAGGGGANTALSNLASVAVNTGLVFGTGVPALVKSLDQTNAASEEAQLFSGSATVTDTNPANSGNINIKTGDLTTNAASGQSGGVEIHTGNSELISGTIFVYTGDSLGGVENSGAITFFSGTAEAGNSGAATMYSGSVQDGTSGDVQLYSGTAVDGGSGAVSLSTGAVTAGSQASGNINITTGNSNDGATGSIALQLGAPLGTGTHGQISMSGKSDQNGLHVSGVTGAIQIVGARIWGNDQDYLYKFRPSEKILAASTGTATTITNMEWTDLNYSSVEVKYTMIEASTGKVRKGILSVVQDMNTAADVAYTDDVLVENASFPAVVLSVISSAGTVSVQFTNGSSNDVYMKCLVECESPNSNAL